MMYNGVTGTYTYTFEYEKKETCPVCGTTEITFSVSPGVKLQEFMELLQQDSRLYLFALATCLLKANSNVQA